MKWNFNGKNAMERNLIKILKFRQFYRNFGNVMRIAFLERISHCALFK